VFTLQQDPAACRVCESPRGRGTAPPPRIPRAMSQSAKQILGPDGPLAQALKSYEHRPQQLEMAAAVERAIRTKQHLVVEAGTGTGKSLAYLTPFVVWATETKKKVLVATHTKALQQQLVDKDLPFLRKATGIEFKYVLCVGSQNYLCLRRLRLLDQLALLESQSQVDEVEKIRKWADSTRTGLVFDLPFQPAYGVWNAVNRESDLCFGQKCEHYEKCLYFAARRRQYAAHVLVANHHLFFANMAADWRALPEFDAVVFDEAQGLEEVASDYLGLSVSNTQLEFYLNSLLNAQTGRGVLAPFPESPVKAEAANAISEVRRTSRELFQDIAARLGPRADVVRVRQPGLVADALHAPMAKLVERLTELQKHAKSEEQELELGALIGRGSELSRNVATFLEQSLDDQVYWVEVSGRRQQRFTLKVAPIDLSPTLKGDLFAKVAPVVLTSATLSTAGSFAFFSSRLGLEAADELAVGSPFDFQRQVLMYLPKEMPDPSSRYEDFNRAAAAQAAEICRLCGGRAFVLFTSYSALRQARDYFAATVPHLEALCQGDEPLPKLVQRFKRDDGSVLLGTNTFWQGIDVPGDALQCVIITKLPFAVPDHPLIEARTERLEQAGRNPFYEYQVPKAIIMFRQGFGRLIRRNTDYGLFALLDPRVRTKGYGELFLKSLPKCEVTSEMGRISSFLEEWREQQPAASAAGTDGAEQPIATERIPE